MEEAEVVPAWHYNSKGIFSAKSAYKVYIDLAAREARRAEGNGSCNPQPDEFEWGKKNLEAKLSWKSPSLPYGVSHI